MTWLLTGGAGYIGAHVLRALLDADYDAVVLDDLSTGDLARVPSGVPFIEASVLDRSRVLDTIREHAVTGVIHLAGKKSVPESMENPLLYYEQNVGGFVALLSTMRTAGVNRIVFSSSCSVIGTPPGELVDEDTPTRPESPYGRSKLACEWLLRDAAAADPLHYANLRYFNVAGAGAPELGDSGAFNLIPLVFQALTTGRPPQVFGDDYPTPDGSCIRDYIHVVDLAGAHVAAVRRLETVAGSELTMNTRNTYAQTLNVGRGAGVSVKEVMATVSQVVGRDFEYVVTARRLGDPARVVGVVNKIAAELGWKAELDLADMVRSAWAAWGRLDPAQTPPS